MSSVVLAIEKRLTNRQSTGPGMEFHHLTHNAALFDATKYFGCQPMQ